MFKNRPIFLETLRLVILSPSMDDLNDQICLQSNPEVMKFIGNGVRKKEEVEWGLEKAVLHYEKFQYSLGSVFEKGSGLFVGRAGIIHLGLDEKSTEIEIAYALLPDFWGKGFASELGTALIQWGFS